MSGQTAHRRQYCTDVRLVLSLQSLQLPSQVCVRTMAEAGPTGYRQRAPPTTWEARTVQLYRRRRIFGGQLRALQPRALRCQNCRLNHNLILIWSVCHPYRGAAGGGPHRRGGAAPVARLA